MKHQPCLYSLSSHGWLFLASIFRKDLSLSQRECEELKIRLHRKEKEAADVLRADGSPRVAGLCLKCAQHEAILADTHGNQHVQTIDRLTKSVEMSTILKIQCIILLLSNAKIVTTKNYVF